MKVITVLALVLILATSAFALEKKAFQMREDFGTEPIANCALQYYYYVPCPTYSWFWMFTNWTYGDIIGEVFTIGDVSMGGYVPCDPFVAHTVEQFRILDFAGYGTIYPGLFTVDFDIYCADAAGCPVGGSLWNSGPVEFCVGGWNYVDVDPDLCVSACATEPGGGYPRILIAATAIGTDCTYPAFGFDNLSTPVQDGTCALHDTGCLPALYPRPYVSHYSTIHSGFYGPAFQYCPPLVFADGRDTSADYSVYGLIELAWRVYLINSGPTAVEPSTWGNIKSMYR
jgi:hypothetical protein